MAKTLRLLDQVHVAAPCPASWGSMTGDERVRHCSKCALDVYNLSEMSDEEAEAFLRSRTGRTCVRYFLRDDGKVMTKNCPRGAKALRIRAAKRLSVAVAFVLAALGCGGESRAKVKKALGWEKFEKPPMVIAGAIALPSVSGSVPVSPAKTGHL